MLQLIIASRVAVHSSVKKTALKERASGILLPAVEFLFLPAFKRRCELKYWKGRYFKQSGHLSNSHYEPLYTDVYDLQRKDYNAKHVLDIGCGPRGSLEWADITAQRVGLDPLVPAYLKLGADKHKMEYVAASGSEQYPLSGRTL